MFVRSRKETRYRNESHGINMKSSFLTSFLSCWCCDAHRQRRSTKIVQAFAQDDEELLGETYEPCSFFVAEASIWVGQASERIFGLFRFRGVNAVLLAGSAVAVAFLDVAHVGRDCLAKPPRRRGRRKSRKRKIEGKG